MNPFCPRSLLHPITIVDVSSLLRRAGLAEAGDAVAIFPLMTGLEKGDAFKTLEDVPLGSRGADGA